MRRVRWFLRTRHTHLILYFIIIITCATSTICHNWQRRFRQPSAVCRFISILRKYCEIPTCEHTNFESIPIEFTHVCVCRSSCALCMGAKHVCVWCTLHTTCARLLVLREGNQNRVPHIKHTLWLSTFESFGFYARTTALALAHFASIQLNCTKNMDGKEW